MGKRHCVFTESFNTIFSNAVKTKNLGGIQIWKILDDNFLEIICM